MYGVVGGKCPRVSYYSLGWGGPQVLKDSHPRTLARTPTSRRGTAGDGAGLSTVDTCFSNWSRPQRGWTACGA